MRFQVILPTFNASRWFELALASVTGNPDGEVLVIDDGSSDIEREKIASMCRKFNGVRFFAEPHRGLVGTLNFGLSIATAPLIARMDADDIALPSRFQKQLAFLESHPEIALVGGQMIGIDTEGNANGRVTRFPTSPSDIARHLHEGKNPFLHPSVMMVREAVLAVGGYRLPTEFAEDYDLWLRMVEHYPLANLNEPLVYYRRHAAQITRSTNWQQKFARDLATLSAHCRRRLNQDPIAALNEKITLGEPALNYHSDVMNLVCAYKALTAEAKNQNVSAETIRWILSSINTGLMGRSSKPQAKAAAKAAKLAWYNSKYKLAMEAVSKGLRLNPIAFAVALAN